MLGQTRINFPDHLSNASETVVYCATGRGANYCDEYVCLSVCLSTRISRKTYVRELHQFLRMLQSVVVSRFSSGRVAICYVLPVLCMTSCFDKMSFMARHVYMFITRQWLHLDVRSVHNTNRKSYLASRTEPSACCSGDRKCPKSVLVLFDFGPRQFNGDAATCPRSSSNRHTGSFPSDVTRSRLSECTTDVVVWYRQRRLQPNADKTLRLEV